MGRGFSFHTCTVHLDILRYKGSLNGRMDVGAISVRHVILAGYAQCEYSSSGCNAIPSNIQPSRGACSNVSVLKSYGLHLMLVEAGLRVYGGPV